MARAKKSVDDTQEKIRRTLALCANSFSEDANRRFNSIFEDRKNGKTFN